MPSGSGGLSSGQCPGWHRPVVMLRSRGQSMPVCSAGCRVQVSLPAWSSTPERKGSPLNLPSPFISPPHPLIPRSIISSDALSESLSCSYHSRTPSLPAYSPTCPAACLSSCLPTLLSAYLPIFLSSCLPAYPLPAVSPTCPSARPPVNRRLDEWVSADSVDFGSVGARLEDRQEEKVRGARL